MPMETESSPIRRRDFTRTALQSLTTLVLIEGLWSRRLLGSDVGPIVDDWFKKLNTISRDVHEHRLKDLEFQRSLEQLFERVDLAALLKTLDFEPVGGRGEFSGQRRQEPTRRFLACERAAGSVGLWTPDFCDGQGPLRRPSWSR